MDVQSVAVVFQCVAVVVGMSAILVAGIQNYRGSRDQDFERDWLRLKSNIDRLRTKLTRGENVEWYEGMQVFKSSVETFFRLLEGGKIKTDSELRDFFDSKSRYRFIFRDHWNYFLSLKNLMDWVDRRKFKEVRCRYAQKVIASLSREELILIMGYGLIQSPMSSTGVALKEYIEKYGMLYIMDEEVYIDSERGFNFRKYYKESAFVEGGSECGCGDRG